MPPIRCVVSNISWSVGRQQLREYFSRFGPLSEVFVKYDRKTGLSEKFGFITFLDKQSYITAVSESNEHFLEGSLMRLRNVRSEDNPNGDGKDLNKDY